MNKKLVLILSILPIGYILDYALDRCVSDVLSDGSTICGAEAEKHVLYIVGTFLFLCIFLNMLKRR